MGPRFNNQDQPKSARGIARECATSARKKERKKETTPTSSLFQISMTHKRQVTLRRRGHVPPLSFAFPFFSFLGVLISGSHLTHPRDTVTRKREPHRLALQHVLSRTPFGPIINTSNPLCPHFSIFFFGYDTSKTAPNSIKIENY